MKLQLNKKKKTYILLFPNTVNITIYKNYLIIKGPFGSFLRPLFKDSYLNLFFNFKKISIMNYSALFNKLELIPLFNIKKNNNYKYLYFFTLHLLKKYIEIVSTGHLNILQMWGIGFKISKKNYFSLISLGFSHSIKLIDNNNIFLKPFNTNYIFITSPSKQLLLEQTKKIKELRNKDTYKGKGIRNIHEKIKLKIGKRD